MDYLEVSRKSLREAYILKRNNFWSITDTVGRREYCLEDILSKIDINFEQFEFLCHDCGIAVSPSDRFQSFKANSEEFREVNNIILQLLSTRVNYTIEYLSQIGLYENKKIAIVDIGWHGTLQNMLETITDQEFVGLYFGNTCRDNFDRMHTFGYWFDNEDEKKVVMYLSMMHILEVMLFPKVGTTIKYTKKEGKIRPMYAPCENEDSILINDFQEGALQFIKDYVGLNSTAYNITPEWAVNSYKKMAYKPTYHQAKTLSKILYEDGEIRPLAETKKIKEYILSPKRFLEDYHNARWKEGFIKQILPAFKYPNIIDWLIKKRHVINRL